MFEKLSTDDVSIAMDELIGSVGLREDQSCMDLLGLLGKKDTQRCVQEIAARLGLPVRINLTYVPKGFRPTAVDGFQSSSLSRTDWAGHGIDGITAQVCLPSSLPIFGSSALAGYPINVRVSENCYERPETFVAVMAHELSHVLLHSLCHPKKESELHTDLVPILLGFREGVRRGRKTTQYVTDGRTTTRTTTYGYLTDQQFEFACSKVTEILNRHLDDKKHFLALTKRVQHKLYRARSSLAMFRGGLVYLDKHLARKMKVEDGQRIVEFHAWDYTTAWEQGIAKAVAELQSTEDLDKLRNYTESDSTRLKQSTMKLKLCSEHLDRTRKAIASDVKILRRNAGLIFRLRGLIPQWKPKWGQLI